MSYLVIRNNEVFGGYSTLTEARKVKMELEAKHYGALVVKVMED